MILRHCFCILFNLLASSQRYHRELKAANSPKKLTTNALALDKTEMPLVLAFTTAKVKRQLP
jgi:hypothetical protein